MAGEAVLIIEDDVSMRRALADNFEFAGYAVRTAGDGAAGLEAALAGQADIIILDLMLPKVNGYEICRQVREKGHQTPIIMLTAKGQESDVVLGLNLGADDYVTKPFSVNELLARAAAFLRRRRGEQPQEYRFGDCVVNMASRAVSRDGREVPLTPKEFSLLAYLLSRPGRALTRDEILGQVWGRGVFVTHRSVDRCVTTLRDKIEPDPARPTYIKTVRQIGYRFDFLLPNRS
jgi:DNA-binding response OmpR family regulator